MKPFVLVFHSPFVFTINRQLNRKVNKTKWKSRKLSVKPQYFSRPQNLDLFEFIYTSRKIYGRLK